MPENMPQDNRCPQCSKPLPPGSPRGLCPACLLACGLETNTIGYTDEAQARAKWTPPAAEQLAPLFPELDILELIGRGGMGAVYKARERQLDRLVALKILPPEIGRQEAFAQRFAHEAQAMAKLGHPNIVTIHSFGQREGLYFFIMEYVDGLSLRQLLDRGTVSPKEALAIVPQICDALQYAHDRGIVHRDIKPENILLNRAGQVKIADFGLAKLVGLTAGGAAGESLSIEGRGLPAEASAKAGQGEGDFSQDRQVMGTPQYMAPEQIERPREVDHRADIYSLGVVFYQMLTGELPKGRAGDTFEPPSRKVLIDVRLDEVVLRALEKEPSRRYQQVSEVKTQVETIVQTQASEPPLHPKTSVGIEANLRFSEKGKGWHFNKTVSLVASRNGRPVIHWSGVLLVAAVATIGAVVLGRLIPPPIAFLAWVAALIWLVVKIRRGLRTPVDQLTPFDSSPSECHRQVSPEARQQFLDNARHPPADSPTASQPKPRPGSGPVIVGKRAQRRVINWGGVLLVGLAVFGCLILTIGAFNRGINRSYRLDSKSVLIALVMAVVALVIWVWKARKEPLERLTSLEEESAGPTGKSSGSDAWGAASGSGEVAFEEASKAVKIPAIGLMVVGGLHLATIVLGAVQSLPLMPSRHTPAFLLFLSIHSIAYFLVFWSGVRMIRGRNRILAITAAILAAADAPLFFFSHAVFLPTFSIASTLMAVISSPGSLIGLPMGIWALVVLSRREVIEAFAAKRPARAPTGPHALRWVVSLLLVALTTASWLWYLLSDSKVHLATPLLHTVGSAALILIVLRKWEALLTAFVVFPLVLGFFMGIGLIPTPSHWLDRHPSAATQPTSGHVSDEVTIMGSVPRPGVYAWAKNRTARQLLLSGGFKGDDPQGERVYLCRNKTGKETFERLVDVKGILNGRSKDINLQPDDQLVAESIREVLNEEKAVVLVAGRFVEAMMADDKQAAKALAASVPAPGTTQPAEASAEKTIERIWQRAPDIWKLYRGHAEMLDKPEQPGLVGDKAFVAYPCPRSSEDVLAVALLREGKDWKVIDLGVAKLKDISLTESVNIGSASYSTYAAMSTYVATGTVDSGPATRQATRLVFGPEFERTVNHTGANCLIDLDSGKVVTLPQEVCSKGAESAMEWTEESGIDAGGVVNDTNRGLIGFDMAAIPTSERSWDNINTRSLMDAATAAKPGNPVFLTAAEKLPTTFIIKTREGGVGLLQILGFNDSPKGTRIRYKLLAGQTSASQPTSPARGPTDAQDAMALMEQLKGFYAGARAALMDDDDPRSALAILDAAMPQIERWQAMLAGSKAEETAASAVRQVKLIQQALRDGNVDQAKAVMAGLNAVGRETEDAIRARATRPATRPATQLASRPGSPTAPAENLEPYQMGLPVEGAACKLRPNKEQWAHGEPISFLVDAQNYGDRKLLLFADQWNTLVEVDGQWFQCRPPGGMKWAGFTTTFDFSGGRRCLSIPLLLDEQWVAAAGAESGEPPSPRRLARLPEGPPLRWTDGTHRVRVMMFAWTRESLDGKSQPVRFVSRAVSIRIK